MVVCLHHTSERYGLISLLRQSKARLGFRNNRLLDFAWTHAWRKNINEYIGLANLYLLNTYQPVQAEPMVRRCFEENAALGTGPPAEENGTATGRGRRGQGGEM